MKKLLKILAVIMMFQVMAIVAYAQMAEEDGSTVTTVEHIWKMTGPFGGDVTALSYAPDNADFAILGTADSQLFKSVDGGYTWKRIRPGLRTAGFAVTAILFDRDNPRKIYIGVKTFAVTGGSRDDNNGGIYYSEDGGETWVEFHGMRGHGIRGLVQSIGNPDVIVAAAANGIYKTKDRGKRWELITPTTDPELRGFHSVAIDPDDFNTIYVGTNHLPWKTTDGGQSWVRAGSKESGMIDDSDIFAIHIDEENPDVVLMSACSGIYRSTDSTETWEKIQGIPYTSRRTHTIYQHPSRPETIFAGTTEGLWLSNDFGKPDTWRRVTSARTVINTISIHPKNPDRVLLGTEDNGVLVSEDSSESYESSNIGFVNRQISAVMPDIKNRGIVYTGVLFDDTAGGLYVSDDDGISWQRSMNGMGTRDVYSLYQSKENSDVIYAGTNHGLFRSIDHGLSWTPVVKEKLQEPAAEIKPAVKRSKSSIVSAVQKRPGAGKKTGKTPPPPSKASRSGTSGVSGAPSTSGDNRVDLKDQVFALTSFTTTRKDTWLLASTWNGLFYTEDEKKGWKRMKVPGGGITKSRINAVAVSPLTPGLIYVGTDDGLVVSHNNGYKFDYISLKRDTVRVAAIEIDPINSNIVYVGTLAGLYKTTNGGQTWENPGGGLPHHSDVSAIQLNETNPNEIYLADSLRNSLYYSADQGKNWSRLDITSLPSAKIRSITADPFNPNKLYLGSYSGGVYLMTRK